MPFSSQEKTRILFYLGYSVFEDDGPAMRAVNGLDAKEAVGGFLVRELLDKIENVRQQIDGTIVLSKAIADGSIQLRSHYTLAHMHLVGRSYVNQLANFIKVSIYSDIFSSGGPARDAKAHYSGDPSEHRVDDRGVFTR